MKTKVQAAVLVVLFCMAGMFTAAQKQQKKQEQRSADRPVAAATPTSIVLTWQQTNPTCTPTPCPITGNQVFRGTTSGGEAGTPLATIGANTTYTDTAALVQGTTYFYQVTAVNANGTSGKSAEASVTFGSAVNVPPTAPTGLAGVAQ